MKKCIVCNKIHKKRGKTCGDKECIIKLTTPDEERKRKISQSLKLYNEKRKKEQQILCEQCGEQYDIKMVLKNNFGKESLDKRWRGKCSKCKNINKNKLSNLAKKRMKLDNPVNKLETRKKISDTLKFNILNGNIKYKKGPDHHLFTGLRDFSKCVRDELYNRWGYWILYRDNFKCVKCNCKTDLHVHHRYPLRNIIKYVKEKYNLKSVEMQTLKRDNWELFNVCLEDSIQLHSYRNGISVCEECHSKIDTRYRGYNENKINKKRKI